MIKLFRNIRKKLLEQGKAATYLKYAIGEIVIVVVLNKTKSCPVRDKLWEATNNNELYPRAFRPACRFVAYSSKAQGGTGRPHGTIKIELQ